MIAILIAYPMAYAIARRRPLAHILLAGDPAVLDFVPPPRLCASVFMRGEGVITTSRAIGFQNVINGLNGLSRRPARGARMGAANLPFTMMQTDFAIYVASSTRTCVLHPAALHQPVKLTGLSKPGRPWSGRGRRSSR